MCAILFVVTGSSAAPTSRHPPPCSCFTQPYVLPEHFFFPLDPEIGDVERPVGVLAVRVVRADNVRREGWRWLLCWLDAACAADARSCWTRQNRSLQQRTHCKVQLLPRTTSPQPLGTTLSQVPKPGLLGSARPLLELFVRDSQRRQTHVAQLAGSSAAWGSRFEFPVSLPGGLGVGQVNLDNGEAGGREKRWQDGSRAGRAAGSWKLGKPTCLPLSLHVGRLGLYLCKRSRHSSSLFPQSTRSSPPFCMTTTSTRPTASWGGRS